MFQRWAPEVECSAVVSSDAPVSVSQIVTYVDLAGNPLSESAVPALLDPDLALEFRVPVDTTGALNTGVALYNPGTAIRVPPRRRAPKPLPWS